MAERRRIRRPPLADRATLRATADREQLEALARLASGESLADIAKGQYVTPGAIGTRLSRLYVRLGARCAAHAVAICYERGLLPLQPSDRTTTEEPDRG